MRLLLLGGTGKTGTEVIDAALARGHRITAFVRSPHKIHRTHPDLSVVAGDPRDAGQLARALLGHDAAISALGPSPRDALLGGSTLLADCAASTAQAMAAASVSRLLIVSAALLFPEKGLRFAFFRWLLNHHIADLVAMEDVVRASGLAWTIARPPNLQQKSDQSDQGYRAEVEGFPAGGFSMSFRAVAAYVLDAVEGERHVHHVVGLAR
jgi:putative NADH-flavin reductase